MLRIVKYLFVLLPIVVSGQQFSLKGTILNETGEGMPYATAVLLDPSDSTLQYYGISNFDGTFEIPKVKGGEYLLQVAFMGFETHYRMATIPLENTDDLGIIVMKTRNLDLDGVDIVSERIPMRIKKDTLE
nr:carboxypeptidase regulatory-like domain-containing protein [Bacteroidota bacterium]